MTTQSEEVRNFIFIEFKLGSNPATVVKHILEVIGPKSSHSTTKLAVDGIRRSSRRAQKLFLGRPTAANKRLMRIHEVESFPYHSKTDHWAPHLSLEHRSSAPEERKVAKIDEDSASCVDGNSRISQCFQLSRAPAPTRGRLDQIFTSCEKRALYCSRKTGRQWLECNQPGFWPQSRSSPEEGAAARLVHV